MIVVIHFQFTSARRHPENPVSTERLFCASGTAQRLGRRSPSVLRRPL